MEPLIIRAVNPYEVEQLQAISKQTFFESFSSVNTEENMRQYLEEGFSLDKLAAELGNELSQFYFAILDGRVIGYLKLNKGQAQTDIADNNALEIERIYVLKPYHGKQVGQMLYAKAIDVAGQEGASYVWLGVWEHNPRAISFYQKNGFIPFDKHVFMLGTDKQMDILMKKVLKQD